MRDNLTLMIVILILMTLVAYCFGSDHKRTKLCNKLCYPNAVRYAYEDGTCLCDVSTIKKEPQ